MTHLKKTPTLPDIKQPEKTTLPTISDIYNDTEMAPLARASAFEVLVNKDPHPSWVKGHPHINVEVVRDGKKSYEPLKYIPIERIEWLLTTIFLKKKVEIKEVKQVANSVVLVVRLWYYNHIDGEWMYQDGVGAAPLQTDKGAGATDWNAIKSNAVQIGAPAAESYAVKDAAEKIGKLFGKDLNRKDVINYDKLATHYVI